MGMLYLSVWFRFSGQVERLIGCIQQGKFRPGVVMVCLHDSIRSTIRIIVNTRGYLSSGRSMMFLNNTLAMTHYFVVFRIIPPCLHDYMLFISMFVMSPSMCAHFDVSSFEPGSLIKVFFVTSLTTYPTSLFVCPAVSRHATNSTWSSSCFIYIFDYS